MHLKNYKTRLHNLKYLNRGIVFTADLLLATLGAFMALLIMSFLVNEDIINRYFLLAMGFSVVITAILFLITGSYKTSIRCSTLRELSKIFCVLALRSVLMAFVVARLRSIDLQYAVFYAILDLSISSLLMVSARAFLVSVYYAMVKTSEEIENVDNALIYGAQGNAPQLATLINDDMKSPYKVIGFLSSDYKKDGVRISGQRIYGWNGEMQQLESIITGHDISYILFTNIVDFNHERDRLVDFCIENNIQMLMGGEVQLLDKNKNLAKHIKPVDIEDLLYRDEINIDVAAVSQQMKGKVILVTGAAGSIGHEIAVQLARQDVSQLILLDCAETPLHDLELELTKDFPGKNISFVLSDVRSENRIKSVFEKYKPNFVFHAAAYKHVPVVEAHPCEGVLTNIWGTANVANHAMASGVEKFVMISTDKAINPTNVMGASKRIAELWVQGMNSAKSDTQFIITRFGNVLGSNGSVIPLFREQIARGGPVTVTHPEMIRYFMTISEACRLVLQAATMGSGGEIFVFDMGQQVKIDNLARRMILLSGLVPDEDIMIEYTGLRPGEKLYEELLTESESTKMTCNEKIRIALVDDIDVASMRKNVMKLIKSAETISVQETVRLMKHIVPEFKSNNSEFETLDKENISDKENTPGKEEPATAQEYEKRYADRDATASVNGVYHTQ